jgi:replication factor C subunit 1
MKVPANVIDQLTTGSQLNIRQVLTMLSTWKLSSDMISFNEGKDLYVSHSTSPFLLCSLTTMRVCFPAWLFWSDPCLELLAPYRIFFVQFPVNKKYTIMSPFDITQKFLGPSLFMHTSRKTLGDKIELYFQDHLFMPLFVQVHGPCLTHLDCGMCSTLFFSLCREPLFLFLIDFPFAVVPCHFPVPSTACIL